MSTPTLDQFLSELFSILQVKDASKLKDFLVIEPDFPPIYNVIVGELRQIAAFGSNLIDTLEKKCEKLLPEDGGGDKGGTWTAFNSFLAQYFVFIRDVDPSRLVATHEGLKHVLNACILALSDASMGATLLPTTIHYSRLLSRLSIGLEKDPSLLSALPPTPHHTKFSETPRATTIPIASSLIESTANLIREALKKCLSERAAGGPNQVTGKRAGIYLCANICLKLFFHIRNLRSAEQIFNNIHQASPPLAKYPASQRVTFLFYLGRYHFANNHFRRAQKVLSEAYRQCHTRCLSQRRMILVYLTSSFLILGCLPSQQLLARPEAQGFADYFLPICNAIKKGDVASFRVLADVEHPHAPWFLKWRVLLQIRNRCEVLVWRSLMRKLYLLTMKDDVKGMFPSVELSELAILARYLKHKAATQLNINGAAKQSGLLAAIVEEPDTKYVDLDFEGIHLPTPPNEPQDPSAVEIESLTASLVQQGLLHGFISHKFQRFLITGAKGGGAARIGFPQPWKVMTEDKEEKGVPGWVKEGERVTNGGGRVIHMSGVKGIGE